MAGKIIYNVFLIDTDDIEKAIQFWTYVLLTHAQEKKRVQSSAGGSSSSSSN
jgi:hypothetical protein